MVELEDARDSKSRVPWGRVGSIPTAGTNKIHELESKSLPSREAFFLQEDQHSEMLPPGFAQAPPIIYRILKKLARRDLARGLLYVSYSS